MILRNRLSALLAVPALVLAGAGLAACGGGSEPAPAGASSNPPSSAAAAGELSFDSVKSLTAPRFEKDPNCVHGEWSENKTGIDEKFRGSATTIQQFDCYKSQDGGFPTRIQQSIYVEFTDTASAQAFGKDEAILYNTLVAGTKVVVAGSGLDSVDMKAYLADLQKSCSCGEILNAGQ